MVIPLWLCGDSIVNQKIARNLQVLHLVASIRRSCNRYPHLISQLKNLRYLSINHGKSFLFDSAVEFNAVIGALPPTLTTIKLTSADAIEAFLNHASDSEPYKPHILKTSYERGSSQYMDFSSAFPLLSMLHLDGLPPSTHDELFAALPNSLTKLVLPEYSYRSEDATYLCLPRRLKYFKARFHTSNALARDLLLGPEGMKIGILNWRAGFGSFEEFKCAQLRLGWEEWSWKNAALVPRLFSLLDTVDIDAPSFVENGTTWMAQLPKTLTSLLISVQYELTPTELGGLPKSLTLLKCSSIQAGNLVWPPALRSLIIADVGDITFPSTLSSLVLSWKRSIFDFECLPPSLRNLTIHSFDVGRFNTFNQLPSNLQSLEISSCLIADTFFAEPLPASITSLILEFSYSGHRTTQLNADFHLSIAFELPYGLRVLKVSHWFDSWLSRLPTTLRQFETRLLLDNHSNAWGNPLQRINTQCPWLL